MDGRGQVGKNQSGNSDGSGTGVGASGPGVLTQVFKHVLVPGRWLNSWLRPRRGGRYAVLLFEVVVVPVVVLVAGAPLPDLLLWRILVVSVVLLALFYLRASQVDEQA